MILNFSFFQLLLASLWWHCLASHHCCATASPANSGLEKHTELCGQLQYKDLLFSYRDSFHKYKVVWGPSYLYNMNFKAGEMASWYWAGCLVLQPHSETVRTVHGPYSHWYLLVFTGLNSSPPGQNGRHFADDIFKCLFVNEKFCIMIKISLKFVPKGPNDNNPALVKILAWRRIGDKPLSEPMPTQFTNAYMGHQGRWVNSKQCHWWSSGKSVSMICWRFEWNSCSNHMANSNTETVKSYTKWNNYLLIMISYEHQTPNMIVSILTCNYCLIW